ncbi:LIM domain-containing protein A [Bactrocera tryoni]|uniref:LIM domain-containing protein A n=1 Tax=Bactrocera tryoni TaxID=59916 RepID=UPI001A95F337|nr:LIM domain-containing protein A [Bactrocera tryoni]
MRCVTDQVCKAHYSKQMDSTSNALHKSSPSATLDIPAVLDQQLAALTHHKRQLEKKAICLSQQNPREKLISEAINFAKSSSYTQETEDCISNIIYSKPHIFSSHVDSTAVDANVSESPSDTESVLNDLRQTNPRKYFNQKPDANLIKTQDNDDIIHMRSKMSSKLFCEETKKDSVVDVPQSHELSIDVIEGTLECSNHQPEEILPPPSPVSSSYSELRKATTVFKKTFHPCYVKNHESKVNCNDSNIHDLCGPYMNVTCSNDFNSYCTTLQTDYNSSIDIYNNGSSSQLFEFWPENVVLGTIVHRKGGSYNKKHWKSELNCKQQQLQYHQKQQISIGSTTYESIYEPIIPRPASRLSSHSNNLNYVQYVNGTQLNASECAGNLSIFGSISSSGLSTPSYPSPRNNSLQNKEIEANVLTEFLVQSLDTGAGDENYGTCFKCNGRVIGENSGCTAMEQIFHTACFTCAQCTVNLQGKPFYALDGKPLCKYDYLQTLEKCSVCMKPIMERILRATGKPYHPQCFTCIICGNNLDGIPFTVDATNQNYCIADFHKIFAPRCCVCMEPIMPKPGEEETVRVVALDRSFHFECYKCEDCGLLLSSEAEGRGCYPLDQHVLCKSCNAKRIQMLTQRI